MVMRDFTTKQYSTRLEFWKGLSEKYKKRKAFFAHILPRDRYYFQTNAGKCLAYRHTVYNGRLYVEVYIAEISIQLNERYFDQMKLNRDTIEKVFGHQLEWDRVGKKKYSRICYTAVNWMLSNDHLWPAIQDEMLETMLLLEKAFAPEIEMLG